ncbi:2Fe-2S iron-sulfur cluster-binding protein [Herbaspirillum sp. alder98]|uniref:2Fe-2S iron-sulfur cluster-binding protein n=1 Tax=Herbaspirillum sp. alder98 TaxID=2913096 RepID=UPI001CD8AB9D|nr:2Fe-2S iron-sulfur cluster-binding protein [Herbaspirillum sp. alder98]MCA1324429.1 2Fe-2S iron-sulfur cluster binding domain-containing protein [Herbaspirillum sp. alder98]
MSAVPVARCESVRQEAGDIRVFTLRMHNAPEALMASVRPGGHVAIACPDAVGALQSRLYSVTRKDAPDLFEIAVKRSGRHSVSDHMHCVVREGSSVALQYAAGDVSVESVMGHERVAMIAGGIGITLPIALIRELAARERQGIAVPEVVLMLCTRRVSDIAFLHELLALDLTSRWFTLRVFVTREVVRASEHFSSGRPDAAALDVLGRPQVAVICGSHAFAQACREQLGRRWPDLPLLVEAFTPPAVPALAAPSEAQGQRPPVRLRIVGGDQVLEMAPGNSLLDMLASANISVRSQCRSGICGCCRIRIAGGQCRFEPDFCLTEKDRRSGHVLACCTFPLAGEVELHLNQPE